jgi:hypothetical protein
MRMSLSVSSTETPGPVAGCVYKSIVFTTLSRVVGEVARPSTYDCDLEDHPLCIKRSPGV